MRHISPQWRLKLKPRSDPTPQSRKAKHGGATIISARVHGGRITTQHPRSNGQSRAYSRDVGKTPTIRQQPKSFAFFSRLLVPFRLETDISQMQPVLNGRWVLRKKN